MPKQLGSKKRLRYRFGDRPVTVEAGGTLLACTHCSHRAFLRRNAYTQPLGVVGELLEWLAYRVRVDLAEGSLVGYACARCGYLHWFAESKRSPLIERTPEDEYAEDWNCLSCGGPIPAAEDRCPACGWTYKTGSDEPG